MMTQGGKTVFGTSIGILMLNTRFPRIPGDAGNALTWPFPVQYGIVASANPDIVVRGGAPDLLEAFVAKGEELVALGCDGISTNCGFLVPFQQEMSARLGVPVATSALMQAGLIRQTLGPREGVGVLTISPETLGKAHLDAAGIAHDTPIDGPGAGTHFNATILSDAAEIDFDQARAENVEAAMRLVADHPGVGAILLECTNMVPYAADIRTATGRPVYSIYTYLLWFHAALVPRRFDSRISDTRFDGAAP